MADLVGPDVVGRLLQIDEKEISRLTRAGVLPRPTKGKRDLVSCVHGYIDHLKSSPAGVVSQTDLANHIGIGVRRIRDLVVDGVIAKPAVGESWDLDANRISYIENLRARASGMAAGAGDLTDERTRLSREQADGQALKNAVTRGELIPAADNAATIIGLAITVSQLLQGVGSKVAPLAHTAKTVAQAKTIIDDAIREACESIADAAEEFNA